MQENTLLLILAMVGLAVGCVASIVLILTLLSRVMRGPLFAFLGILARSSDKDDEEVITLARHATPNLRAIANQHDFDSALSAHQQQAGEPGAPVAFTGSRQSPLGTEQHPRVDAPFGGVEIPPTARLEDPPDLLKRRGRSDRRKRERVDYEDEALDGFFEDEGGET